MYRNASNITQFQLFAKHPFWRFLIILLRCYQIKKLLPRDLASANVSVLLASVFGLPFYFQINGGNLNARRI